MLTVKICKPNGHEVIVEATSVLKEPNGVLVQNDRTQFFGPLGDEYGFDADIRQRERSSMEAALQEQATVYVMNRFGATVSTYRI